MIEQASAGIAASAFLATALFYVRQYARLKSKANVSIMLGLAFFVLAINSALTFAIKIDAGLISLTLVTNILPLISFSIIFSIMVLYNSLSSMLE